MRCFIVLILLIFHLDAVSQIRFKEAILNRTCIGNGKEYSLGKEAIKYLFGERDSIIQFQYVKFPPWLVFLDYP